MDGNATGPAAKGRLSHLFLRVRDFDRMLGFYRRCLGLPVVYLEEGRCVFFDLDEAGVRLALYAGREDEPNPDPHWFLVIDVDDLEATVERLRERAVPVGGIEEVPSGRAATFKDPEGNTFEVHQADRAEG